MTYFFMYSLILLTWISVVSVHSMKSFLHAYTPIIDIFNIEPSSSINIANRLFWARNILFIQSIVQITEFIVCVSSVTTMFQIHLSI